MASILVVEDDPVTANAIVSELSSQGHDVKVAATGNEALRLVAHTAVDAITLDRLLPDMDGLSVVERLRRTGSAVPVLMVSALSDVDERIAGLRAGGDDYLVKPFAPDEMAMRIEVLLRRSAAVRDTALRV